MMKKGLLLFLLLFVGRGVVQAQSTIPSYVPTQGLVGWWPFNQQYSNQVGTFQNFNNFGTTLGLDRNNVALQSLKITQNPNCSQRLETVFPGDSIQGQLTFSFWLKRDSSGCDNPRPIVIHGSLPDPNIQVMWWNYSPSPVLSHADGVNSVGVTFRPVNNQEWVHIVYSNDGDSVCFYQNGSLIQKIPNTMARVFLGNTAIFGMLGMNYPLHGGFYGHLDDIAIYNRALSAAEVQQLYTGQSACNLSVQLSSSDTLSICGTSTTLNAGNAGSSFLWNNGATSQTISLNNAGWYRVTVSNNLCSVTDSVYVDFLSVDLGNDTAICAGETVKLTSNIVSNNTPFFASNDTIENYNNFIFTALDTTSGKYRIWTKSSFQSDYQPIFTDQYHRSHPIPSQDQKELIYVRYKRNILYPSSNPIRNATMDSSWICKSNIDGTNEQILFIIPNFNRDCIFSLDWSYDKTRILLNKGNDAYPNLTRDGDIFEYNLGTNQLVNITNNWDIMEWGIAKYAPGTYDFYYTPSGTGWYSNDGQIYKYNRSSNTRSVIIPNSYSAVIGVSSDGTNLYYRKGGYPNLYQKNLSTGIETSIIQNPGIGGNEMSANLFFDVAKSNFLPKNAIRLIKNSAVFNQLIIPQVKDFELDGNAISYNVSTLATDAIWLGKWTTSQIKLLWSTGDTTPTINVSPTRTTTYYCTVSNGISTCTDSIVVTVGGSKQVNLFNDTTSGCGSVNLSAGNNATSYLWNTGDTTSTILVKQSGWYGVTVGNGICLSFDSTYVDLLSVDLGNDTAICAGETYVINPFVKGNPNLKNGLMAAYSFDGNAYDFSGNGNHGKPQGVTATTDRFGNPHGAYFFRGFGNNDHIFVKNNPSLHIDSVYTMSLWYKEIPGNAMSGVGSYAPTNGTAALFAKEGDGIGTPPGFFADINYNTNGYTINYLQVDGCCGVRSKFQSQYSHQMPIDSSWKHLVIINTKDYSEMYVNGAKVKFTQVPSTFLAANRNNMYFGTYGYGQKSPFWYPFYGSMDEVFMYNRALDSNEIRDLYLLQNSQNQFTYTWSNGATTPYIGVTPTQTTTYYCTVSNGITSCVDSVTITVKPNPPVVSLPDTLFQCGNPGRLDAGNPGATYLWSNKATTQSILPVNGGWYSVVVNQNGCTATDSSFVDLLTVDLGKDTSICIGSSVTLSVQGQNNGNTTPDSIFVPSDASWKVSLLNPEGWEYVGFNDTNSFWPSAKIQGTSSISGALPIWYPDSVGIYDAYFRKVFEVNGQPNPDFELTVSAENEYYAFVNGRFVGYGNSTMIGNQTYPIASYLVQGYNSVAIFASNWGASTAQLTALITGTTDKKTYLWTTGDTTSSITVSPTRTTTYYCTVTNGYTFCTDSIVVLVGTPQATVLSASTCSNQPYVFGRRIISQPGVYVDSLRSSLGCDSVVTLTLNVNPSSSDTLRVKVCGNQGYSFGGAVFTQPGMYVDTLPNSLGCDSVVTLDLQFAQPDTQRISASICQGSSYAFNGQNLNQSGVYQAVLTNIKGCDSLVILQLNVNQNPVVSVNDTICRGQVYSFGGQNYFNSGRYSYTTINTTGCTTTVVLNLWVNEIQKAVITANGPLEFCRNTGVTLVASAGRAYLWSNGSRSSSIQVAQSQVIWVEVTDANGCKSRSDSQFTVQRLSVPNRPDTILGFLNPCGVRGTTNSLAYSVDRDSNATSYSWLLTDGITAVSRTDSHGISVTYPAGYTTGQIRVTPVNACGSGLPRAIYPRTGQPNTTPVVTQSVTSVCGIRGTNTTATYTIQPVDGCNSYLWTLPSNTTLVSGQGTTSIQVRFGSSFSGGVISVAGVSPCGNSPIRNITVSLLAKPIISGSNTICSGSQETYTIPVVPGAIRYRFNLPSGLVLVSQNLNTAVIRNHGSFVSGTLGAQVQTTNCGWSQPGTMSLNTAGCRSSLEVFSVILYPNPSRGEFQLHLGAPVKQVKVNVYSTDGRWVKRQEFGATEIQTLNYTDLAEGLYHVEVIATDGENNIHQHMEKVMIQR